MPKSAGLPGPPAVAVACATVSPGAVFTVRAGMVVVADARTFICTGAPPLMVMVGGMLMAFVDMAMGQTSRAETGATGGSTVSLNSDFVGPGRLHDVVEARVRVTRRARTMIFLSAELAPEACAVVEDSQYGVQAARAAGMAAFGYAGSVTPARMLEGPGTTVFDDMRDLPRLLQSR